MSEAAGKAGSLRWRLVSRMALVLGCLMVAVNLGFFVFLVFWLPDAKQADEGIRPAIARSITSEDGRLAVGPDAAERLAQAAPGLWFAASAPDGRQIVYGVMPPEFSGFLPRLNDMRVMDLRSDNGPARTTALVPMETEAGRLNVLYGGVVPPEPRAATLFWGLKMIYIPFTVAPVLIVFIAIPIIVAGAMSGVARTTSRAASIDAKSLGVRLPKDDVFQELHPLVEAVNAGLARIDEDVSRRQRFLANAAHELRTPIAILQTRIETLAAGPERDRLLLDVRRLSATAEQLLDLQRFSAVQAWEDVDLVKLCETVAADIAPLAIAAGYDIGFERETERFLVKGDYASLERAVTNLGMNAVEHGGGSGRILFEVLRNGTVEISDEGPGISAAHREKVFEPFYRVRPKSTGAGLGLSLVHQIARSHDGHVSIIEQERGARFRLSLHAPPARSA